MMRSLLLRPIGVYASAVCRCASSSIPRFSDGTVGLRPRPPSADETVVQKRARLVYQSKKRGILENDIILGRFADKHLGELNELQLATYDTLINGAAHNEWDIYYWLVGTKDVPADVDSDVFEMLKLFAWEENKDNRAKNQ